MTEGSRLTDMERRAVAGMEAIYRDLLEQQARERQAFHQDFFAMLAEIAEAHGLPESCWVLGYEIDPSGQAIMAPEETEPAPPGRKRKKARS